MSTITQTLPETLAAAPEQRTPGLNQLITAMLKSGGHISDLIVKLKETLHKTSIVVTHDTHLAKKLADHVIFLHDGGVKFFGTWPELEASQDHFLRNFLLQDELIPALDETA